jgi:predicted neutral ceramidase superfamily lipid hydrolase
MVISIFSNLNDLVINRFKIDYVTTGYLMMIPYALGSILALVFGKLLIIKPKIRRSLIILSPSLLALGILSIYLLPNNSSTSDINALDFIVIVVFLIFLSAMTATVYTVVSSSTSLLVDKKRLGTAWGVIGMAIGLGQSISPIINGLV